MPSDVRAPVKVIAIGAVVMISGEENDLCRLYRERMTADLKEKTGYVVAGRERMEELLREIELSQSDFASGTQRLEVGKMVSAEGLLDLVIAELSEGTEINARLTKVETGTVLYARSFRDFREEPAAGRTDYDPQRELRADDYKGVTATGFKPEGAPELTVLRPGAEERAGKLGEGYRRGAAEQLGLNNRMLLLSRQNPELYRALIEARRRLAFIANDKDLLLLFVFRSPRLSQALKERHPLLARRLAQRFQALQSEQPRKDAYVRSFLARYARLLEKDRLLAGIVSERLEQLARSAP